MFSKLSTATVSTGNFASVGVQNLEKNYRDFQFRVTHLDPIIAPEMHQQEKSRAAAPMQKELMSDLGNGLCLDSEN